MTGNSTTFAVSMTRPVLGLVVMVVVMRSMVRFQRVPTTRRDSIVGVSRIDFRISDSTAFVAALVVDNFFLCLWLF